MNLSWEKVWVLIDIFTKKNHLPNYFVNTKAKNKSFTVLKCTCIGLQQKYDYEKLNAKAVLSNKP